MDSSINAVLERARSLRDLGRYSDAVQELEGSLETCDPNLELAVELGESLSVQGYFGRAVTLLERHMVHMEEVGNLYAISGILICCCARFRVTCQFQKSVRPVERSYQTFLSSQSSEIVCYESIRIEKFYSIFWRLVQTFGSADYTNLLIDSMLRLKTAFDTSLSRGDFSNALNAAGAYSNCTDEADSSILIETLATNEKTPALHRARAQFLLAKKLTTPEIRNEQDRLFAAALKSFQDAGHNHGPLDVMIAKMCRLSLKLDDDSSSEEKLARLFEEYKVLDYPTGLNSAYLQLLTLATGINHRELQKGVLNELERLNHASADIMTWVISRIAALGRWAISGGAYGKVLSGATALWNDLAPSDCSILRIQAANIAFRACEALKDDAMTGEWWTRTQQGLSANNTMDAPFIKRVSYLHNPDHLRRDYEEIVRLVEFDLAHNMPRDSIQKLENFVSNSLEVGKVAPEFFDILSSALVLNEKHIKSLSDTKETREHLARLRRSQGQFLVFMTRYRQDVNVEIEAVALFSEAVKLYLGDGLIGPAAITLGFEAYAHFLISQKFEQRRDPQASNALMTALNMYKVVLDSAERLGLVFLCKSAAYWVAKCHFQQWERERCSHDLLLDSLLSAERFTDKYRLELSVLHGIQAVITKRNISSDAEVRNIYQFAIQACYRRQTLRDAWKWAQKSKARSLSDILGLGILIPQELADRINGQESTRKLFQDECLLLEKLSTAPDEERFPVMVQLEDHQKTMRAHNSLNELLNLREGVPAEFQELQDVSMNQQQICKGRAMIFVDWVMIQSGFLICVLTPGGDIIFRPLLITAAEIQSWVSRHLNSESKFPPGEENEGALSGLREEDEAEDGPLRELDALVAPLSELSRRDDLLVFCPSGILHSLPLHALRVGPNEEGNILIVRNPIVYCASLTSFKQCCQRASAIGVRETPSCKNFLAVYEPTFTDGPDEEGFSQVEKEEVYSSVKSLADYFRAESSVGSQVSYDVFKGCLQKSDMVHFHGHCDSDTQSIVDQSLRLSNAGGATASLTVTQLFDLRIKTSHISLLACGSASQHFVAGDEPLGLVTAFLSAGASSVLGTLWPIQSSTARLFSEKFYDHIRTSECGNQGIYDLANAVREAVQDVRHPWDSRHPYHWASFVLHGAWFFNGSI